MATTTGSEPVSILARQVQDALRTGEFSTCPVALRPLLTELYAMHRKMLANWVPLGELASLGRPLQPPNFRPLEEKLGRERARAFTYVGRWAGINIYKHRSLRLCLNLTDNGECWVYTNGRYEPGDFAEQLARIDAALAKNVSVGGYHDTRSDRCDHRDVNRYCGFVRAIGAHVDEHERMD